MQHAILPLRFHEHHGEKDGLTFFVVEGLRHPTAEAILIEHVEAVPQAPQLRFGPLDRRCARGMLGLVAAANLLREPVEDFPRDDQFSEGPGKTR